MQNFYLAQISNCISNMFLKFHIGIYYIYFCFSENTFNCLIFEKDFCCVYNLGWWLFSLSLLKIWFYCLLTLLILKCHSSLIFLFWWSFSSLCLLGVLFLDVLWVQFNSSRWGFICYLFVLDSFWFPGPEDWFLSAMRGNWKIPCS